MGGCRCSYRNCTARTDGTTHMFHYPVFDKLRCHQWLTNAQKHEFLNLKVSQLKNRVVCQHHFKDEYFMNFKKDKLTFKAIPTLNGPFCEPSPDPDNTILQDEPKMYPISLDDIENEYLTLSDKKANFSVKYGDFLTNSEVMDMDSLNITLNNNNIKKPDFVKDENKKPKKVEGPSVINLSSHVNDNSNSINILPNESTIVTVYNQPLLEDVTPVRLILVEPTVVGVEFKEMHSNVNNPHEKNSSINNNTQVIQQDKNINTLNKTEIPPQQKVKILSQKKIREPVSVMGKLKPIPPSFNLRLPENRRNRIKPEIGTEVNAKDENNASYIAVLNNTNANIPPSNEVAITVNQNLSNKRCVQTSPKILKNTVNVGISSNKSLLKPKINQDRVVAIEEKRKFNMKLRDIIESCLDKIDNQDSAETKKETNTKIEKVGTFLSKEPVLPSVHEYTIACLEARMKRMEDVLLNKIDQNTQRIMDLKNSIVTSDKKSICTQTSSNEESKKKHLFKEISKYLSADASSLIYEELFINKYAQSTSQNLTSPKKRRRR